MFKIITLCNDKLTETEKAKVLSLGFEDDAEDITKMIDEAENIAVPKAIYDVLPVAAASSETVLINGIEIHSALMCSNFSGIHRVFPYVHTCGTELEQWSEQYKSDPLAEYWADSIKLMFLGHITRYFSEYIKKTYTADNTGLYFSSMNPGSIKEWPISGQKELFGILGRETILNETGVRLTESMLMLPSKSVSGIGFFSNEEYQNCSRCPLKNCPNRRAEEEIHN